MLARRGNERQKRLPVLAQAGCVAVPIIFMLTTLPAGGAGAWGTPHTEITRHALKVLPVEDDAENRLGGIRQLEDLSWGADYAGHVHARYYVDDYLLWPGFAEHVSHLMPDVRRTWRPYFSRTLLALRAETPENAARWLGSLLHFVEDSGSPSHALPTGGEAHTRMENWLLPLDIRIPGYRPQLLAVDEESAGEALVRRLDGLVAHSRSRAELMLPHVREGRRGEAEPLILDAALETTRAAADVMHTLLAIAGPPEEESTVIHGAVNAPAGSELPLAPARILVQDASLATSTRSLDIPAPGRYSGSYSLRGLPVGEQTLIFHRPGSRVRRLKVRLRRGEVVRRDVRLDAEPLPGNLLRNADGAVRWLKPGLPDHWRRTSAGWRSDAVPVVPGRKYQLRIEPPGSEGGVFFTDTPRPDRAQEMQVIPADDPVRASRPYAVVLVNGPRFPRHVSFGAAK